MRDERWRDLEPHLDSLLDLPAPERRARLENLRTEDPALAADLEVLLALGNDADRERFLEETAAPAAWSDTPAGQSLGAYTLIEPVGQGGMGTVWLARRSDGRFEGRVAVKLLNVSLLGRGEERFRREGSILARLDHPNIARLLDAGVSASGQPYLVLEYVDGEPIDAYCDRRRLDLEARLRLLLDVAAAVSLAHANLVVHRDIKPSNVLVGRDGRVKLLDFGIAKLLEDDGAADPATALTREGGRVFTPEFAAPEQLTGGAVTTATDVHALGTLAYLLLAGRHPAGVSLSTPALLLKAIVDTDPRHPSEAVIASNAAARATTEDGLRRRLRGDLDTIVTKALKKDPAERYASVDAMAGDIRRFLADEPIGARPDTWGYRAAKFSRRHRVGVALGALVLIAALSGTVAILWQANEVRKQRDAAQAQLARATASSEFLAFLFSAGAPAGQKFVAADLLQRGEVVVDKQFPGDNPLRAELLAGIGMQHLSGQRFEKAQPVLERAEKLGSRSNDPALRARVRCPLALAWVVSGQRENAEALISKALAELPQDSQHALARAECLTRWSEFGFFTDEGESMVLRASEALATLSKSPVPSLLTRLDARAALAYGHYLNRQIAEADAAFAALTTELERLGRDRTLAAADAWNNWGLVHHRGEIRKAEPLYRRSLEIHRAIAGEEAVGAVILHNYAGVLQQLARYSEAEPVFREAILAARARENYFVEIAATLELAGMYAESGRLDDARATIATLDHYLGKEVFTPLRRAFLAYTRGLLASARGDAGEARTQFAESVRLYDGIPAKFSSGVLALLGFARAELAAGRPDAAEAAARRALALAESFVGKGARSYLVGLSLAELGRVQIAERQAEAGRTTLRNAFDHLQETLGPEHPATLELRRSIEGRDAVAPTFLFNYAGVLYRLGQYDEAQRVFQETIRTARDRQMSRIEVDAMMQLADVYTERGDFRAAEEQLDLVRPHLNRPYFNPLKRALLAYSRGLLALGRGEPVKARAELAESTALFESAKARLAQNVHALIGLARAEAALGNGEAAEAAVRRAVALAESMVERGSPSYLVGCAKAALGEIQLARGQPEAARTSLTGALTHLQPTLGTDHPATSAARRRLTESDGGAL